MTGDRLDKRAELDALLVEYEGLLNDERSYNTTLATLASVALALFAFIAAGSLGSGQIPICKTPTGSTCTYFRLFSPLAPLVIILYVEAIAVIATIRSFQLRLAEERIRDLLPEDEVKRPPVASVVTTLLGFTSLRRGARTFRLLHFTILVLLATIFSGVVGFSISKINGEQARYFGYAFYGAIGLLLAAIAVTWLRAGPSLWRATYRRARERYSERMGEVLAEPQRGLTGAAVGYFVLPRPLDLVKGLCALGSGAFVYFAAGKGAQWGSPAGALTRLLIAVVLFELLAYQARYQLNDVRGLMSDLVHRARAKRRRLTLVVDAVGVERAVKLSLFVVLLRLSLFIVLAFVALPERASWTMISTAAAAFVISIPYEWLRERRSSPSRARLLHKVIYVHVGLGYGVRAALGVLIVTKDFPLATLGLVCLTLVLLGGMFVTMTWALEGTSSLEASESGAQFDNTLDLKNHIRPLTAAAVRYRPVPRRPRGWKILSGISDRRFALPWNQFLLGAAVVGASAAAVTYAGALKLSVLIASEVAAVATAWILSSTTTRLSRWLLLAGLATAGLVLAIESNREGRSWAMSFGLLVAIFAIYVQFRDASYKDLFAVYAFLGGLVTAVPRLATAAREAVIVGLIGRWTLALLQAEREGADPTQERPPEDRGARKVPARADNDQASSGEEDAEAKAGQQWSEDDLRVASRVTVKGPLEMWNAVRALAPATLILDVEPLVCLWDTGDEALLKGLARTLDQGRQVTAAQEIIFITNSRRLPSAPLGSGSSRSRYIEHARKPFARRKLGRLDQPVVVCGDQVLTDGILAWFLGAVYIDTGKASISPLGVKVQHWFGRLLSPFLFTTYEWPSS